VPKAIACTRPPSTARPASALDQDRPAERPACTERARPTEHGRHNGDLGNVAFAGPSKARPTKPVGIRRRPEADDRLWPAGGDRRGAGVIRSGVSPQVGAALRSPALFSICA
jgi:hypothetical protein